MTENLKQSWTAINHREHHQDAVAKRVVNMPNGGRSVSYEDTNFIGSDSPALLAVNTDLGRDGIKGYIINDGEGSFIVEFSDDGTNYGGQHTLKNNEVLNFESIKINRIRLTYIADSAYRVFVI